VEWSGAGQRRGSGVGDEVLFGEVRVVGLRESEGNWR
jgi:hypothetical protein